jgi:hypothetical protein
MDGDFYFQDNLIFIIKQYNMGKFIITESEKRKIKGMYGLIAESEQSEDMSLIQNELEANGISEPVEELVDPQDPLCTAPETGDPEQDNILSKVWEWAQSQSKETLEDMKLKIKDAIAKAKEMVVGKKMNEQVAPLLVIGGVAITANVLLVIGGILLLIIVISTVAHDKSGSRARRSCKRRRRKVRRFGIKGYTR